MWRANDRVCSSESSVLPLRFSFNTSPKQFRVRRTQYEKKEMDLLERRSDFDDEMITATGKSIDGRWVKNG